MKANPVTWLALLALVLATSTFAGDGKPFMRVLDVGTGECVVMRPPGGGCMVYDTGDDLEKNAVMAGLEDMVPASGIIDLLVLSHNDCDHIGNVAEVLAKYEVKTIVWIGDDRTANEKEAEARKTRSTKINPRSDLGRADAAIRAEGANIYDLSALGAVRAMPVRAFKIGDASVFIVSGFGKPHQNWGVTESKGDRAVRRNCVSIVVRVVYGNQSILIAGDAVGRKEDTAPSTPAIMSERYLIDNCSAEINCDALIAPHHGGDNASSDEFIDATSPQWVIFSAGHRSVIRGSKTGYFHPRAVTVKRYLAKRIPEAHIFRTDLGDNEGEGKEWKSRARDLPPDLSGDDDVDIVFGPDGKLSVAYAEDLRWGAESAHALRHRGW